MTSQESAKSCGCDPAISYKCQEHKIELLLEKIKELEAKVVELTNRLILMEFQ